MSLTIQKKVNFSSTYVTSSLRDQNEGKRYIKILTIKIFPYKSSRGGSTLKLC